MQWSTWCCSFQRAAQLEIVTQASCLGSRAANLCRRGCHNRPATLHAARRCLRRCCHCTQAAMAAADSTRRTRRARGGCTTGRALLAAAALVLLALPHASARPCSSTTCSVSFAWAPQKRSPSSVSVDCTPQTLQQTGGLLLHPAVLTGGLSSRETATRSQPRCGVPQDPATGRAYHQCQ
jgi:hypothetical protein